MSSPFNPEDLALLAELAAYDLSFARAASAAALLTDLCDVYDTVEVDDGAGGYRQERADTPRAVAVACAIAAVAKGAGGQETAGPWQPRGNALDTTATAWLVKVPVGTGLASGQQVVMAYTGTTFRVLTVDDQSTWRVVDEARCERLGIDDA